MFPNARSASWLWTGSLFTSELVNTVAATEEDLIGFVGIALHWRIKAAAQQAVVGKSDVEFHPVCGLLEAIPTRERHNKPVLWFCFVSNSDRDFEHLAFWRGLGVIFCRRRAMRQRGAKGLGPGIHLFGERFHDIGMRIGHVG